MKVMTILGSPKKKGNTAKVLGWLEEELEAQGNQVSRTNIIDREVRGCLGCLACQEKPDEPGCVQEDDTMAIFEEMMAADAVVYATPLYCWGFSSQMKALIDRHNCLATGYRTPDYKSVVEGKRTALLVTCDGPVENNADLIQECFSRLNDYVKAIVVGKYVVPGWYTEPDSVLDKAKDTAKRIASDIAKA